MRTVRYELFRVTGISMDSADAVARRFRRFRYSQEKGAGFIVDEVRPQRLGARFVEFRTERVGYVDPFGEEQFFDRPIFETTTFQVSKDATNLVVSDCPRSRRAFLSALSEVFDDSLVIESAPIDLLAMCERLKADGLEPVLTRAILSNVTLSRAVSAKVHIQGSEDVRPHLRTLTAKRPYKLSIVTVHVTPDGVRSKLDVSAGGRLRITSDEPEFLLGKIRGYASHPGP
jgi:hypothetical protein